MQVLPGQAALTSFSEQKLLAALQAVEASIKEIHAEYVYFVDSPKSLTQTGLAQLENLLPVGDSPLPTHKSAKQFLIIPRLGTISPWSTKATDIVHNSGLRQVRRVERGIIYTISTSQAIDRQHVATILHDRMTESVLSSLGEAASLFATVKPQPLQYIDVQASGHEALQVANKALGLALADDEIVYLHNAYQKLGRNPTDVELMMFGAVNSEHCRHKIFNADWLINDNPAPRSLFGMIRNTYEKHHTDILSAYSDNAAVLRGSVADRFFADPKDNVYRFHNEPVHLVIKVETHNHPTAIAPFPGAATGVGGEIRDEGATGRGAKPKMGLAGYSVSNLNIPAAPQPWETVPAKPSRIVSPMEIMLKAPIGAATYSNEFGRPNLVGYFRTYEQSVPALDPDTVWGYHKPLMAAGGLGNIRDEHVKKGQLTVGTQIILLGGPSMLIGLGGGAASSMETGSSAENLDFASVQRANAEMEHRVQEVINQCWAQGVKNPIISIHDVGAGGISNALPEIVHDSGLGAHFELRKIPSADPSLSPMEIWSNESQERYVLGVSSKDLTAFEALCRRERCPYAIVGVTTKAERLLLTDSLLNDTPVDLPMSVLFGKPPKMTRTVKRQTTKLPKLNTSGITLGQAVERVLQLPAVGSKKFLITIGDRNVGGLIVRDQMVGKWQVPVSDVAVTASSFTGNTGEAMAMGERTPLALIDAPSSARIAIGEAVTNIAAASINKLSDIKLSANWMAAAGYANEDQKLYDTVQAVGEGFCPALGLTIPVGKDSLSMRTVWEEKHKAKSVTSPLSLIITAFTPVRDIHRTLTPELQTNIDSRLLLIDLGQGRNRLGGSALAQVYNQLGNQTPDIEPVILKNFFKVIQKLNRRGTLLAYHDRSDGGLLATLTEMMFASRCGLSIDLSALKGQPLSLIFNEELGAVVQVASKDAEDVAKELRAALGGHVYQIGQPTTSQQLVISQKGEQLYRNSRAQLESWWSRTSYELQRLRDNPSCAEEEFAQIQLDTSPGLTTKAQFFDDSSLGTTKKSAKKPRVAIFREQGVNGQVEMAAAFDKAGFTSVDVHIQDLLDGTVSLNDFSGLAACGGFSYGDVLGAGEGWAKSILFHPKLRREFAAFFKRPDTFSLGVCNGCQMLSALKELIPGTEDWPRFLKNTSEQFEARLVNVRVNDSPSIFFKDMAEWCLPVPVAHGEGRAVFANDKSRQRARVDKLVALQFVDGHQVTSDTYPQNPNGSGDGITSLTTADGRATILMPHPERAFLSQQLSWHPDSWQGDSPWFKMFQNAYEWSIRK